MSASNILSKEIEKEKILTVIKNKNKINKVAAVFLLTPLLLFNCLSETFIKETKNGIEKIEKKIVIILKIFSTSILYLPFSINQHIGYSLGEGLSCSCILLYYI